MSYVRSVFALPVDGELGVSWMLLAVLGVAFLLLFLWLVRFAFRRFKTLATFVLGFMSALVLVFMLLFGLLW